VPWVHSWPFGYISDPQYVGSILTFLGTAPFVPLHYTCVGVLSYCLLITVERQKPSEAPCKDESGERDANKSKKNANSMR
jgi:methylene-fatty-acyl-phospholipid synthase